MRDGDLRSALSAVVARQYQERRHVLVPEVDIVVTYPGRIDALLVADRICGFEIKSDVDSLRRLPRQVEIYGPVLERATLVVGKRHASAAADIVPSWWAIWEARHYGGGLVFATRRRGRLNPDVDPFAVATFIPRDVVLRRLRAQGMSGVSKRSVAELRYVLAETNSKSEVLALARSAMLARPDWQYRATHADLRPQDDYALPGDGGSGRSANCVATAVR
ncbi:MAG: sce7726 family protein [Mycolicibacterium fortuitum]